MISEIETAIDYYADLFVPFLEVRVGKASYMAIKALIDEM